MAKIRTLKAEFFRNADISRGGLAAKVMAAGAICAVADDDGLFKAKPDYLKGEIFTHDSVTIAEIDRALRHLDSVGFIRLYKDHGSTFGAILNWKTHQPVPPSRYKTSELPAAPNTKHRRHSPTNRKHLMANASSRAGDGIGIGAEGKEEGNRSGRDISPSAHSAGGGELLVLERQLSVSPTDQVWLAWLASRETWAAERGVRVGTMKLDDKRLKRITDALASYPLEDVVDAVQGWLFIPHNRGENDRNRPFNDIELLLRDSQHIETFRDATRGHFASSGPAPRKSSLELSIEGDLRRAAQLREKGL